MALRFKGMEPVWDLPDVRRAEMQIRREAWDEAWAFLKRCGFLRPTVFPGAIGPDEMVALERDRRYPLVTTRVREREGRSGRVYRVVDGICWVAEPPLTAHRGVWVRAATLSPERLIADADVIADLQKRPTEEVPG